MFPFKKTFINFKKFQNILELMRVNQPAGFFLLLWPTVWSFLLSKDSQLLDFNKIIIFFLGTFLMRSAGCIINDYIDQEIDKHVERTKNRPLLKGLINKKEVKFMFIILTVISFMLVLMLNLLTIFLSIGAIILVFLYPLTKRYTHLAQFILGIAFSWPILMVFSSISENLSLVCILLFIANISWVIAYDTQYAMLDKDDDLLIGVKSTAILFDKFNLVIITTLLQLLTIILFIVIGVHKKLNLLFYLFLLGTIILFIWQNILMKKKNKKSYFKAFINNNYVGIFISTGIFLG